jgi:hypothetical protein
MSAYRIFFRMEYSSYLIRSSRIWLSFRLYWFYTFCYIVSRLELAHVVPFLFLIQCMKVLQVINKCMDLRLFRKEEENK